MNEFDADIKLIAGEGGIFVINVNGVEIFSKKKAGHTPTLLELVPLINQYS
jgi:predicted Rdx family selenoprotein